MLTRLTLWLAARILRRRRYSPACPIAKRFASWAAGTIGKPGRDRWNRERRWRKVCAWADADLARRDREYALWLAQNASQTPSEPLAPAQTLIQPIHAFYGAINTFADSEPLSDLTSDEYLTLLTIVQDAHRSGQPAYLYQ